jgi:hypothetical protein
LVCLLWVMLLMSCGVSTPGGSSIPPVQAVATAKAALTVGYAPGDSASSVTQNLTRHRLCGGRFGCQRQSEHSRQTSTD